MSIVKKVVKFVEETENTKQKKMQRSKERNAKYEEPGDTKVIEEPPQHETQKEFEQSFALYKRTCNPSHPLYQSTVITERRTLFKPIIELEIEIMQPSVHPKDPLYQSTVITESRTLFKPIQELEIEIMQPSVHYKQGEGEGWESDCDGWFD